MTKTTSSGNQKGAKLKLNYFQNISPPFHQAIMSAPNEGRQSPEPERQSDKQQAAPPADPSAKNNDGSGNSLGGKDTTKGHNDTAKLASNPEHPLEKAAEEKTSKTVK